MNKSLQITFKAKPVKVWNADQTDFTLRVCIPELKRCHCDMAAFRCASHWGSYANSTLFEGMLKGIPLPKWIDQDNPPDGFTVYKGFLTTISFTVTDSTKSPAIVT